MATIFEPKVIAAALLSIAAYAGATQAATYRYTFEGTPFDAFDYFSSTNTQADILDHSLRGAFDASMKVSGYVELSAALGANLNSELIEFSSNFLSASFSDGQHSYTDPNVSLLASTDSQGQITDWSLTMWGGPGPDFRNASASSVDGTSASYDYEYLYDCSNPSCGHFGRSAGSVTSGIETASAASDQIGAWSLSVTPAVVTQSTPIATAPLPASLALLLVGLGALPVLRRKRHSPV